MENYERRRELSGKKAKSQAPAASVKQENRIYK